MNNLIKTFENFIISLSQNLNIDKDTLSNAILKSTLNQNVSVDISKQTNNKCENLGCTKKYKKINKIYDDSIKREINVCTNCFRKLNSKSSKTKSSTETVKKQTKETPNSEDNNDKEPGEACEDEIKNIDFHFGNEPPVEFIEENKKWWKCKTIKYYDKKYKLHLNTNLVFKIVDKSPVLFGLYRDNEIHTLEVLSDGIIDWCYKSGIEVPSDRGDN